MQAYTFRDHPFCHKVHEAYIVLNPYRLNPKGLFKQGFYPKVYVVNDRVQ